MKREFISKIAKALQKHVGRAADVKVETFADELQTSVDTIYRSLGGDHRLDDYELHRLAKGFATDRPELVQDVFAAILEGSGFRLVRDEGFSRDELDANGDGRICRTDAAIHQNKATEASLDKGQAVISGEQLPDVLRIDPQIAEHCAKATAAMRLASGLKDRQVVGKT